MQPRAPPRFARREIDEKAVRAGRDANERRPWCTRAATDARSYGLHSTPNHPNGHAGWPPGGLLLVVLENRVRLNVDASARELGREARILPFLADSERELEVGHERTNCLRTAIQHEGA